MIGGGAFTLVIALLGCMGSLWHNRCLLYTYAIILGILMVLELVGIILAAVYKSDLEKTYRDNLSKVFIDAVVKNDTKVLNAFHELENTSKCCGVNGFTDYTQHGQEAPPWCYVYTIGCSFVIIDLLNRNLPIIYGTLSAILVLELFGLISAIVLAIAIKNAPDTVYSSNPAEVLFNVVPTRRRYYNQFS